MERQETFRPLKRALQAMSREECLELLQHEKRGVLSVVGDMGYPYSTPMNHLYLPEDGCIWFHCGAGSGHRTEALSENNKVCFCCTDGGVQRDGHWSLDFKSVVVFGTAEIVRDPLQVERVSRLLSLRFTADMAYIDGEVAAALEHTVLIKLTPHHISGKKVNEA